MKGDVLVSGLVRRRRELTRDIAAAETELERLRASVRAIDEVLAMYRPDMDATAIPALAYSKPADSAPRGVMARTILGVLRASHEPLWSAEITRRAMAVRGIAPELYHDQKSRVAKSLAKLKAKGRVTSARSIGRLLWSIST